MTEFRFAHPVFLILLFVPLLMYLMRGKLPEISPSILFSDIRLTTGLHQSWRVKLRAAPNVIRSFAWVLIVIALARPQSGQAQEIIRGKGIDIVLALDISTSMAALDFEPLNRLETAKAVLREFINQRDFDQIGLVVFARNAFHQSPLTLDYPVVIHLLEQVVLASDLNQTQGRRLDGTAIGLGIASSANMLRRSDVPSKTIILLTDGANNAGLDPIQAAQAAQALGIRIYTIGMGKPGLVNIPDTTGSIVTIESDLDEDVLQRIAEITNGLYFRAEDTIGLQQVYDQINSLERSDVERRILIRWRDQAYSLLFFAILFLIIERILRYTLFQVNS